MSEHMTFRTLLLLACSAGWPDSTWASGQWELLKSTEGMEISTRPVPGSDIKALKVEARIRSTVERLSEAYLDEAQQARWYPSCKSIRRIRSEGPARKSIYQRIDNPWPVLDRDYVLAIDVEGTPEKGLQVSYRDVKGLVPEVEGCVRMRKLQGYWRFTPEKDGFVAVTYVFEFDPGGDTPASFLNMALEKIGKDTVGKLFRFVESDTREAGPASGPQGASDG